MKFLKPTLVTLTAPTCAGKNHLLEILMDTHGFNKLVGTTTREKRRGEVDGLDYHFISKEKSAEMKEQDLFAEYVEYNGTAYGVTHTEMETKLGHGMPPAIVILTPHGLEQYQKYCKARNIAVFKIFVSTPEAIRIDRLTDRTNTDIAAVVEDFFHDRYLCKQKIKKILAVNNARLVDVIDQERNWDSAYVYNAFLDGTSETGDIEELRTAIMRFNTRTLGVI